MATISIYVPDQEPVAYDLDGYEQLTIGKDPESDIVLDHHSVSGAHALIQNIDGSLFVSDAGSTNGTFVNGNQITEAVVLGNGSQVSFGNVESVISDGEQAGEEEGEEAESGGFGASSGGSGYGAHAAELSDVSNKPEGFSNLSPIEKVVKKDAMAMVAMLLGVLAIIAAIAVIGISTTMSAG